METYFVILAVIFSILSTVTSQSNVWLKERFPNPLTDKNSCGRRGVVSWICDPDGILAYEDANILEEMLQSVSTKTKSGCSIDSERPGFQIGVAVMNKMAVPSELNKEEVAQDFARHLHNEWGVGSSGCDDGAVLLLSVDDRQIFISTGRTAKERLSDDQIDIIINGMKSSLRGKEYGKALHLAAEKMHQVFDGKRLESDHSYYALLWFVGFLAIFFGILIYNLYKNKQYESCQEKLKRIEKERNAAKQSKKYVSSSCPICLEEFTPQMRTRLLLCGHKYCEPCLIKWLETNSTCPICRQSTNKKEDKDEDKDSPSSRTLDFFPELAFRLLVLQRQYPAFITQDMIHHWTARQYHDSFVNDPIFTRARPATFSSNGSGSLGSGGGFGGGGCSSGGGRGGSW
jgi:uncharacterized membrane protein YgcG